MELVYENKYGSGIFVLRFLLIIQILALNKLLRVKTKVVQFGNYLLYTSALNGRSKHIMHSTRF